MCVFQRMWRLVAEIERNRKDASIQAAFLATWELPLQRRISVGGSPVVRSY